MTLNFDVESKPGIYPFEEYNSVVYRLNLLCHDMLPNSMISRCLDLCTEGDPIELQCGSLPGLNTPSAIQFPGLSRDVVD